MPDQQQQPQSQPQQQDPAVDKGKSVLSGPWMGGCDSWSDATGVTDSCYRWSVNCVSRGGAPRTRPGQNCFQTGASGTPQGLTVWQPNSGTPYMIVAIGGKIYTLAYPFTGAWQTISGLTFSSAAKRVYFVAVIQSVTEAVDSTLTVLSTPLRVLMICDGISATGYWDGTTARKLDPTTKPLGPSETPTFERMVWSGQRLWGSLGSRVRVSNLGNPLKFTEEDLLSEGGVLVFSDDVTAMGQTPDFKNLLVFTNKTTTSIPTTIYDRTQWGQTSGFQTVIFPEVGCAAGKSIFNMYGMTWWFSHEGLINLDQALQTYRTSRRHVVDQAMNWSKNNMSADRSGICCGTYENFLMCAVPSGDTWNSHIWVLDEAWLLEQLTSDYYSSLRAPVWNGVWKGLRPVEFFSAVVKGVPRCFCLSYDLPPVGSTTPQSNVWELFIPSRVDNGFDHNGNRAQKRIDCTLETKVLGYSPDYKDYRYIEVDVEDLSGTVNGTISYAPLRGGYKQVQSFQIVASQWNVVNGQTVIVVDTFAWNSYRPQTRIVRSQDDLGIRDDQDSVFESVESTYQRQTDQGFSIFITWSGQMAVRSVRLTLDSALQDKEGNIFANETTDRHVQMSGVQTLETTTLLPQLEGMDLNSTSEFVGSNTRRWVEPTYQSLT